MSHIYYVHKDDINKYFDYREKRQLLRDKIDEATKAYFPACNYLTNEEQTFVESLFQEEVNEVLNIVQPIRILSLFADFGKGYGTQETRNNYYAMYNGKIWFYPEDGSHDPKKQKNSIKSRFLQFLLKF